MNNLIASLPSDVRQRLAPHLSTRPLSVRETLHKEGARISEIFFPGRSVVSITHAMEEGGMVEVATVGPEGLVGIGTALGDFTSTGTAFVQVAGEPAHVLPVSVFQQEFDRREAFHHIVTRYTQAFIAMVMQSVACNGLHSAEERCSRWLLMTHDRIQADEFALTHEFLAMMLGVRRPTVTLVLAELSRAGVVSHVRGRMKITDRRGLESMSCECYRQVRSIFQRLPQPAGTPLANFHGLGSDLLNPTIERMSDVSRKSE
jgi:CRP-like cAMP-binding protein